MSCFGYVLYSLCESRRSIRCRDCEIVRRKEKCFRLPANLLRFDAITRDGAQGVRSKEAQGVWLRYRGPWPVTDPVSQIFDLLSLVLSPRILKPENRANFLAKSLKLMA